jgi:hypothetical protein
MRHRLPRGGNEVRTWATIVGVILLWVDCWCGAVTREFSHSTRGSE